MFNICPFLLLDCDLDVPPLLHPLCPFHCHSYQFLVSFLPFPPLCVTVEFPPSWLPPPPSPPSFVSLSPPPSLSLCSLLPLPQYVSSFISQLKLSRFVCGEFYLSYIPSSIVDLYGLLVTLPLLSYTVTIFS